MMACGKYVMVMRIGGHQGAKVDFFSVESCKPGTTSGYDTVEKDLDSGDVLCWGADLARVVDEVAADVETQTFHLCFSMSFSGN
jgi:hypothetical protein